MTSPFPFFVGCERSGTTLLRAIFDSHPEVAVAEECNVALTLARDADRYERKPFEAERFIRAVVHHPFFFRWNLAADELARAVRADAPQTLAEGIRSMYGAYAAAQGKPRCADKNPRLVLHMPRLAALLPEAKFVHIIRDGRDVALSLLDVRWGPRNLEEAAFLWRKRTGVGVREGRALGPDRYYEIRYEELVAEPDRVVRGVCAFLELSFEPQMLRYFERAEAVLTTKRYPDEHPHLYQPPTVGLRDWRTSMTAPDRRSFEAIAGDLLRQLGYDVQGGAAPARARVRSRAARARLGAISAARRLQRMRSKLGSRNT